MFARVAAISLWVAAAGVPPTIVTAAPARVKPARMSGKQRRAERRARDASEGGTRRGAIEYSLGAVTAAASLILIGRGGWELAQADSTRKLCRENPGILLECRAPDPARGHFIAAGLSLGFGGVIAVASGLLFARGAKVTRDYRRWRARERELSLQPAVGRDGGGLLVRWRF